MCDFSSLAASVAVSGARGLVILVWVACVAAARRPQGAKLLVVFTYSTRVSGPGITHIKLSLEIFTCVHTGNIWPG